jgi:hypothetical protein
MPFGFCMRRCGCFSFFGNALQAFKSHSAISSRYCTWSKPNLPDLTI